MQRNKILWHCYCIIIHCIFGLWVLLICGIITFYHHFVFDIGVMAARGILANPAMYAGYDHTTMEVVQDWVISIAVINKCRFLTRK